MDSQFDFSFSALSGTAAPALKKQLAAAIVLGPHDYYNDLCKICTSCAACTGYGSGCFRCGSNDRSNDKGKACGCGSGKSGCRKCGVCDKCGGNGHTCGSSAGNSPGRILAPPTGFAAVLGRTDVEKIVLSGNDLKSSSSNSSYNVSNVATDDTSAFWQSNSSGCPHHVSISVPQNNRTSTQYCDLEIYANDYGSFSPEQVDIHAGNDLLSLQLVKSMTLPMNSQWVTLVSAAEFRTKFIKGPPKVIKFTVTKNNQGGCDTKVSCLRLLFQKGRLKAAPKVMPLEGCDRVVIDDSFSGRINILYIYTYCVYI